MSEHPEMRTMAHMAAACVASFILYFTGLGLPLFIFPLLLVTGYHGRGKAWACFAIEAAAVILHGFVGSPYFEAFPEIAVPLILFELYIPLSLSAAGAIWIGTEGRRLETRLALSILPSAVYLVAMGMVTGRDTALSAALTEHYGNVFETMIGALLGKAPGAEFMEVFMDIFVTVSMGLAVPLTFCFACVSIFFYETSSHSRETGWEERVMRIELDGRIVWGPIITILGFILARFVTVPPAIGSVLFSALFLFSMLYYIQGFSVVYYWIGSRTGMKSMTLFMVSSMILLLAQGINIILFFAVCLIGLAETFFDLRR